MSRTLRWQTIDTRLQALWPVLRSPLFLFFSYLGLAKLLNTFLLTIVTSIVLLLGMAGDDLGNTVNEIASQFVLGSYALAALAVALLNWLGGRSLYQQSKFWNEANKPLWHLSRPMKLDLLRGAGSALLLALLVLSFNWFMGQVDFLGLYITSTLGTPVFPLFVLDFLSLIVLVVCEEYLFRYKILGVCVDRGYPWVGIALSSLGYISIRVVQFELTGLDILNLVLLNMGLGFLFLKSQRIHRGLGFLTVYFVTLHSVFGLPLWGHRSPSLFLFKYNAQRASELLTGMDAGPMASIGSTSVFVFVLLGAWWSWRLWRGSQVTG